MRALIIAKNGFYWQGLNYGYTCEQSVVQQGQCAQTLRQWCSPTSTEVRSPLLYQLMAGENCGRQFNATYLPGWEQDLANFLLIRGDYAWLGYAFGQCDSSENGFPNIPALHADYGASGRARAAARARCSVQCGRERARSLARSLACLLATLTAARARPRPSLAGVPTGNCSEVGASGVFVRDYTKASVRMDCNSWSGTVTPK